MKNARGPNAAPLVRVAVRVAIGPSAGTEVRIESSNRVAPVPVREVRVAPASISPGRRSALLARLAAPVKPAASARIAPQPDHHAVTGSLKGAQPANHVPAGPFLIAATLVRHVVRAIGPMHRARLSAKAKKAAPPVPPPAAIVLHARFARAARKARAHSAPVPKKAHVLSGLAPKRVDVPFARVRKALNVPSVHDPRREPAPSVRGPRAAIVPSGPARAPRAKVRLVKVDLRAGHRPNVFRVKAEARHVRAAIAEPGPQEAAAFVRHSRKALPNLLESPGRNAPPANPARRMKHEHGAPLAHPARHRD